MFKEFKEFAMRGSVVDLAIGVVIGGAFGKIVDSVVNNLLMPPIGLALGKVDFSNMYLLLSGEAKETLAKTKEAGGVTMDYGIFLNTVITFLIVAFFCFLVIKAMNKMKRAEEAAPPPPPPEPPADVKLLTEIRDLLKAR